MIKSSKSKYTQKKLSYKYIINWSMRDVAYLRRMFSISMQSNWVTINLWKCIYLYIQL